MDPQSSSAEHLDDSPTATAHSKRKRRPIVAAVNQRPTKHQKSIPLHRPDTSTEDHDPEQFATSRLTLSFTKKDTTNDFIGTKPHSHAPLLVPSGEYHDSLLLSAQQFFADKQLTLARAGRKTWFAKERVAIKLLEELEIFQEAVRSEIESNCSLAYKAQQAAALADASRETLRAEKDLAAENVAVAKLLLKAEEEKLEEVMGKLNAADIQYGTLLYSLRAQNLDSDWAQGEDDVYRFKPQARHQERWPYPGAMDNESGSSGESAIESLDDPDSETSNHTHDDEHV